MREAATTHRNTLASYWQFTRIANYPRSIVAVGSVKALKVPELATTSLCKSSGAQLPANTSAFRLQANRTALSQVTLIPTS
jgi:hypothetical protein